MACPYWDPTLDNELNNPSDSCLFTDKFAGNPNGKIELPNDNWEHEEGGYVIRNVGGFGGELLTKKNVYDVLSRKRHAQITNSKSRHHFLEELHEKGHRRYDLMDGFGKITNQGFGISDKFTISDKANDFKSFRNIDGFSDHFTKEIYQCQSFSSCCRSKPSCGSPWLDSNKSKWVCVPKTNKANLDRLDSTPFFLNTVQNRFEVNGNADSNQWVYINCLIVFQRPHNVKFKSFPIHKGVQSNKNDIYILKGQEYNKIYPKAYDKHITLDSGFEKVNVHIEGTNYDRRAIEYAIVDARFGISESMTYLPVWKPINHKATHVLLTAFDSGGRLYRPYCRDRRYPKNFVPCTGCLKIDTRKPRMYSYSYVESVSKRWDLHNSNDKNCPRFNNDGVYIKFFCNFLDLWPWEKA
ncbi:unnamed protein product [Mytilus coruscus]|uniref:Uncharacterized protein n=1 Tax=Mytilus coruscus TaxID=42192 RepID=A0A6J8CLW1_MYTCO|nr:unnamed protein product [Mytilus coruscus]